MLLRRCAWHRRYHGHVKFLGVAKWRGLGLSFSDGMCADCSARARAEWALPGAAPLPPAIPGARSLRPDFALATGVLLVTVGVAFGILIGPPPRTVSAPIEPATSVATEDRGDPAAGRDADGAVTPRAQAVASATADVAPDRRPDTIVGDTTLDAGWTRSLRIVRAVAKRPARLPYQPARGDALERVNGPARQGADTSPNLSSGEISPLDRVPLQAP
jgi:hypothetical protein